MNDKIAKNLRHAAGYRNQTRTPGVMDFPGVARFYRQPVVSTRQAIKTCYVWMVHRYHKVQTKVTSIVVDRWGKGVMEMESFKPGTLPITDPLDPKKVIGYNTELVIRPKEQLVPVSKPGRLRAHEPKGIYRALKRMWRRGTLVSSFVAAIDAVDKLKQAKPA